MSTKIPMRVQIGEPVKARQKQWMHHDLESIKLLYPDARVTVVHGAVVIYPTSESQALSIADMTKGCVMWGVVFDERVDLYKHGSRYEYQSKMTKAVEAFIDSQHSAYPEASWTIEEHIQTQTSASFPGMAFESCSYIAYFSDRNLAMLAKLSITF